MRRGVEISLVACLLVGLAATAQSQEPMAVLPIRVAAETGVRAPAAGPAPAGEVVEGLVEALAAQPQLTPLDPTVQAYRVGARYIRVEPGDSDQPGPLDAAAIEADVLAAEDAFYEMRYADAVAVLGTASWLGRLARIGAMGSRERSAEALKRGLMALARAYFFDGDLASADRAIELSVRTFPTWVATVDWYQPEFVERFGAVRARLSESFVPLTVSATGTGCLIRVNGLEADAWVEQDAQVSLPVLPGRYALRASCEEGDTWVHLVEVEAARRVVLSPIFDQAFDPDEGGALTLNQAQARAVPQLPALVAPYADVVGVSRVLLVARLSDRDGGGGSALQLVDVDTASGEVVAAVRASRGPAGEFPVEAAVSALYGRDGEAPGEEIEVWAGGEWRGADAGDEPTAEGANVPAYVALGVGAAGLVAGTVFAILEASEFDDFEACRADPVCAGSDELASHRDASQDAGVLATIGIGLGVVGAMVGIILLILDGADDEDVGPDSADAPAAWVPSVGTAAAQGGGLLRLEWRF